MTRQALATSLQHLDSQFFPVLSSRWGARIALGGYARKLAVCAKTTAHERERCALEVILGPDRLAPSGFTNTTPEENSATHALTHGRGSCASLVAVILALTEDLGSPFNALVLRDHVLLGSSSEPSRFYEVLESGRELRLPDASAYRRAGPTGPIRASGSGFLPYYLDNIAARLANSGRADEAADVFELALSLGSNEARIQFNFGSFLATQGQYDAAARLLTSAIEAGWLDADAYINRGVARRKLGQVTSARSDFKAALALDPTNPRAISNLQDLIETANTSGPAPVF